VLVFSGELFTSGTVALLSRSSQKTLSFAAKPIPITAAHVLDTLRAISQIKVCSHGQRVIW
jgi:hypothetical protein